jgi:formylglycine-generating enzyme required for sulfatase activity
MLRRLALAALCILAIATDALAERRVALVVGNSAYTNIPRLANPASDARLMAETLRGLGFALVGDAAQLDLDEAGFRRAVQNFGAALSSADVGLFYYAGHGVQVRGTNYLVPIGANPTREADIDFQMLDANLVLRQMEGAGTKLNLVILDACRNNPFGGRGLRAADTGLAQMRAPEGTLISFATQPGNVAQDGSDGNSPYTRALADAVKKPGVDIFRTFNEVGLAVSRATGGNQQPWVSLSPINGDFYFNPAPAATAPAGTTPSPVPATSAIDPAAQAWASVRDTNSVAILEEFLRRYPDGMFAGFARARIEELKQTKTAAVIPPVVPPPATAAPCGSATSVSLSREPATLTAAEECALQPKDAFRECSDCPDMVVIPAGIFSMGAPLKEKGRNPDEGPQHDVTFRRPLAVGKFEVTVDQFSAFAKATGFVGGSTCRTPEGGKFQDRADRSWHTPGYAQTGSYPVVCVSWDDAQAYVGWLKTKTGRDYRLLTEAEWEYAARGRTAPGDAPKFFFGNDIAEICRYGNVADQSARRTISYARDWTVASCDDGHPFAAPVGSFAPNPFGLHDVHGNAMEWTADCYHDSYRGAPTDGSAWTSGECSKRVLRSGAWSVSPDTLGLAFRSAIDPSRRNYYYGFRVARTLAP